MKIAYRPEIDGLRTIAVLGVLLFHLRVPGVSGGFAGVDVFFVISGYLISRNILGDINHGRFSFADFYARRARRILPALIFTVVATFIAGLLWLSPIALRQLSKESTHALLSIANIQYWREFKQYFSPSSDELALLHCWSLSLEEQFYLIWPIFLVLIGRSSKSLAAIAIAGVISLGAALYWVRADSSAVFFLMPFRIFEFAIGAAVIFLELKIRRNAVFDEALTVLGLVAILGSFVFFNPTSSFALVTLIPCLGTAAIILGGSHSTSSKLLTSAPFLTIGRASYSLYLCHWPLIVFARIIFGEAANTALGIAINFAIMIALSLLMRRYIEQPFRSVKSISAKTTLYKFGAIVGILVAMTYGTFRANGLGWRLNAQQKAQYAELLSGAEPCAPAAERRCMLGDPAADLTLELIGDSYATHYMAGLDALLKQIHQRAELSKLEGCPVLVDMPVPPNSWDPKKCEDNSVRELARVKRSATHVMISHNWFSYRNDRFASDPSVQIPDKSNPYSLVQHYLERTIDALGKPGRKFLIVGAQVTADQCKFDPALLLPSPLPHALPPACPAKPREQAKTEGEQINEMLRAVQKKFPDQVELWLPVDTFCDAECPSTHNGTLLYLDGGHFNVAGSRYAVERAHDLLVNFLKQ
jgi:peptidoglycan/LPS O-acetylase OafA/YrhL